MKKSEKEEYRKFKNSEKILTQFSKKVKNKKTEIIKEYKKDDYTYISRESKNDLWKNFWKKIDKFYFDKYPKKIVKNLKNEFIFLKRKKELKKINFLIFLKNRNFLRKRKNKKFKKNFIEKNLKSNQKLKIGLISNFIKNDIKNFLEENLKKSKIKKILENSILAEKNLKIFFEKEKNKNHIKNLKCFTQKRRSEKMMCNLINLGKNFFIIEKNDKIYQKKNFYFLLKKYNEILKKSKICIEKIISVKNKNFKIFLEKKFLNLNYMKKKQTKIVINFLQMKLLYFSIKKKNIFKSKIELFLDPVYYPSKKLILEKNFSNFEKIKNFFNFSSTKILYNENQIKSNKKNSENFFCHQCQLIYSSENLIKICNKKNGKTPPTEQNSVIEFGKKKKKYFKKKKKFF